ncbi:MAG: tetratricopeptide repeat protein [Candidatus Marinimicrobia bacterium]|nr:tetratricopeptide repeat protein [Candidatus Neomarinimicrobiota bacterium]
MRRISRSPGTLSPKIPKAPLQIARIYSELENDNETALEFLDKTIDRAPKNGDLKAEKARILAKVDRVDEALAMFDQALETDPENMAIGLRYAPVPF